MTDLAPKPTPTPTLLPEIRDEVLISDEQAMLDIHQILNRPGPWSPDTLDEIRDVVMATGRRLLEAADIQVEMLEDLRGWPIAHLQSDGVVAYVRQAPDGGLCFDIHTQDDPASPRLRFMVDGDLVHGPALLEGPADSSSCNSSPERAITKGQDRTGGARAFVRPDDLQPAVTADGPQAPPESPHPDGWPAGLAPLTPP